MPVRNPVTADELVRGKLVPVMTPAGEQHGALAAFLTVEIGRFVRTHRLGRVYVEVGYRLNRGDDLDRQVGGAVDEPAPGLGAGAPPGRYVTHIRPANRVRVGEQSFPDSRYPCPVCSPSSTNKVCGI